MFWVLRTVPEYPGWRIPRKRDAGIAEMLVQSHPETGDPSAPPLIRLLPALPSAWPEGEVRGLRTRGGYTVDLAWKDGLVTSCRITGVGGGKVPVRVNGSIRETPGEPLSGK